MSLNWPQALIIRLRSVKTSITIPIQAAAVTRIPVGVSGEAVPIAIAEAEEEAIVPVGETGEAAVAIEAHRALFLMFTDF